jgi:hypothetical protein
MKFAWQARAGVKDIDLRLGDSFQPSIHRVVAFTPLAEIDEQVSEEREFILHCSNYHQSIHAHTFGGTVR